MNNLKLNSRSILMVRRDMKIGFKQKSADHWNGLFYLLIK